MIERRSRHRSATHRYRHHTTSAIAVSANALLLGTPLDKALEGALVSSLLSTGTAFGADAIGDLGVPDGKGGFTVNEAGRHMLHALLGCASGAVQAGREGCAAGGAGAVLGELAAGWFNPDGTRSQAETLAFAQLIAGLGGALATGSAEGVGIGGTAGGNAAEYNYLRHAEAMRLGELQDLKLRGRCDATCERGIAELETLDKQRNSALAACEGQASSQCQDLRQDVRVAAADYIRAAEVQLDLRYGQERDEALALARQSMGGMTLSDMAGGYAQATQEGLDALWQGAKTAAQALLGDPQAQAELREGAGQFWDTVQDPKNWPYLLGAMTPQQREELAQAYERGDIKAVGRLTGAQVANLPAGGGMGSIKKVGVLPTSRTSPVDIAHTIGADYHPKTGKVTGGHTLVTGDVRVTEIVSGPDANGVYTARVEMRTPDGTWIEKTSNGGVNTMFPKDWDAQRVQVEIESAWATQKPHPEDKNKWIGTSSSGVEMEGYKQPRTTAYPLHGGKNP